MKKAGKRMGIAFGVVLTMIVGLVAIACIWRGQDINRVNAQILGDPFEELPDEYSLTYQIVKEDDTLEEITLMRDEQGTIYYKTSEKEMVFIPDGEGYLKREKGEDGTFSKADDTVYTEDYMKDETSEIQECINKSNLMYSSSAEQLDDEVFLGRKCNVYEIDMVIGEYEQKDILTVDKETGICMAWGVNGSLDGYDLEESGSFTCTEFSTKNVQIVVTDVQ